MGTAPPPPALVARFGEDAFSGDPAESPGKKKSGVDS